MKGSRIHGIVRELRNENIDVINYTNNLQLYITRALNPAKIKNIEIDEAHKKQMSTSIRKKYHWLSVKVDWTSNWPVSWPVTISTYIANSIKPRRRCQSGWIRRWNRRLGDRRTETCRLWHCQECIRTQRVRTGKPDRPWNWDHTWGSQYFKSRIWIILY